jgi:hypothetical protein
VGHPSRRVGSAPCDRLSALILVASKQAARTPPSSADFPPNLAGRKRGGPIPTWRADQGLNSVTSGSVAHLCAGRQDRRRETAATMSLPCAILLVYERSRLGQTGTWGTNARWQQDASSVDKANRVRGWRHECPRAGDCSAVGPARDAVTPVLGSTGAPQQTDRGVCVSASPSRGLGRTEHILDSVN